MIDWSLFFLGWLAMSALMTFLWVWQRRHGDAGIVDVGWAYGIGILALFYSCAGEGAWERRLLVAGVALLWSLRLGTYLLRDRVLGRPEDGRYQSLRRSWGAAFQRKLFWFYQAQGAADSLLSLPILVVLANPRPDLSPWEWLGAALVVVSVIGETVADRQLAGFRHDPANRGKTCRRGLWAYSRHPNYFFEWLHWLAYPIMALAWPGAVFSPWWWLTPLSAVVLLYLILRVTGIPPTEAQALRSRGDDYRRYQREVSAFVPWPNRASSPGRSAGS